MENPLQTLWRPVRWLLVRVDIFMRGVAASGGPVGLIRNFRDPEVRRQIANDRHAAKRDKEMSRRICETTNPAARAVLVKMLIGMRNGTLLPEPSSYALRGATGFASEQINDTRNDTITAAQERNLYERTSRRMSFMRMCIGKSTAYTEYIEEHREAVGTFIRSYGVTVEELLETIRVIGNELKPEYDH